MVFREKFFFPIFLLKISLPTDLHLVLVCTSVKKSFRQQLPFRKNPGMKFQEYTPKNPRKQSVIEPQQLGFCLREVVTVEGRFHFYARLALLKDRQNFIGQLNDSQDQQPFFCANGIYIRCNVFFTSKSHDFSEMDIILQSIPGDPFQNRTQGNCSAQIHNRFIVVILIRILTMTVERRHVKG